MNLPKVIYASVKAEGSDVMLKPFFLLLNVQAVFGHFLETRVHRPSRFTYTLHYFNVLGCSPEKQVFSVHSWSMMLVSED